MRLFHRYLLVAAVISAAPAFAQAPVPADEPLRIEGALDAQTPRNANGRRFRDVPVRLEGGRRYRISVTSSRFDPMLEVRASGSDEVVIDDDDSGGGLNPRAVFTPAASGDYVVRTLGFLPESVGGYRLVVEQAPPLPAPIPTGAPGDRSPDATRWLSFEGTLEAGDAGLGGARFDDYEVTLAAGEELLIRLDSSAFDPLVQVLASGAREGLPLASDDDQGPGVNALLLFVADAAGNYIVRVGSFGGNGTGPYRLRLGR